MSSYEEKPGDITIFRNDKATPENRQPEYQGSWVNAQGEKCNVGLWVRTAKTSGKKFFSGRLDLEPWNQESSQTPQADPFPAPSDDVPF